METAGAEQMPDNTERKGLGTPATRAGIIEKLVKVGFIERKKSKQNVFLLPTGKGVSLITALPEEIQSPALTAEWEQRLKRIEQGLEQPEDFMRDIRQMVIDLTRDTRRAEDADQLFPPLRERIGSCPKCGAAITERPQGFMCENRTCDFALWKDGGILKNAEKPLTSSDIRELLEKGAVKKTGLRSAKTHTKYDATLHLDYGEDGRPRLRPTFD